MNHIAPEKFNYILLILNNENWINHFNKDDCDKILFISEFIKPLCIWDLEHHKIDIPVKPDNNNTLVKSSLMTRELIQSLLGLKKADG